MKREEKGETLVVVHTYSCSIQHMLLNYLEELK